MKTRLFETFLLVFSFVLAFTKGENAGFRNDFTDNRYSASVLDDYVQDLISDIDDDQDEIVHDDYLSTYFYNMPPDFLGYFAIKPVGGMYYE